MSSFFNHVASWMVAVFVTIMRLASRLDVGFGYLLGLFGIGPTREVYILLGISLITATMVFRGLGGIIGWLVVMVCFLMLIDLQLPQLGSADWVTVHVWGVF